MSGVALSSPSALVNVLVLRQAQDEDDFNGGSLETLILSLSKDEGFFPPPVERVERSA